MLGRIPLARVAEVFLLGLILGGVLCCLLSLSRNGYLPVPFLYFSEDTFMDWYNTAYWANNGRAYEDWGALYPPLSFIFVRIFSVKSCYSADALLGRNCDPVGLATFLSLFILSSAVAFASFRKHDRTTSLLRGLALALGFPMLYALERGNLVFLTFTCFVLAYGSLLRPAWLRWLAFALSVNFKPYLAIALLGAMIRRRWRWIEGCVLLSLILYLASFLLLGEGTPTEILLNQVRWLMANGQVLFAATQTGSSYTALFGYLAHANELHRIIGTQTIATLAIAFKIFVLVGQVVAFAALTLTAIRHYPVPTHRLVAISICAVLTTIDLGLYADIFVVFLVFLEKWHRPVIVVALVSTYLLCVPADIILIPLGHKIRFSYLAGHFVSIPIGVTLGSFVRPGLLLVIQYALTAAVLADVIRVDSRVRSAKRTERTSDVAGSVITEAAR